MCRPSKRAKSTTCNTLTGFASKFGRDGLWTCLALGSACLSHQDQVLRCCPSRYSSIHTRHCFLMPQGGHSSSGRAELRNVAKQVNNHSCVIPIAAVYMMGPQTYHDTPSILVPPQCPNQRRATRASRRSRIGINFTCLSSKTAEPSTCCCGLPKGIGSALLCKCRKTATLLSCGCESPSWASCTNCLCHRLSPMDASGHTLLEQVVLPAYKTEAYRNPKHCQGSVYRTAGQCCLWQHCHLSLSNDTSNQGLIVHQHLHLLSKVEGVQATASKHPLCDRHIFAASHCLQAQVMQMTFIIQGNASVMTLKRMS